MPYIEEDGRKYLDPALDELINCLASGNYQAGWINYTLTRIMIAAYRFKPRYWMIAVLFGTVICALFEFYRRIVAKHEDKAIETNGDIPGYDQEK